ncbi:MAG TPA: hypothetical protein VEG66_03785 [Thermoplasmata archaeon]|jgi:hypothetical protein|nr:hypothetical protein [Thermoplasmata archaeon]
MAPEDPSELSARLARIERDLKDLHLRVAALERLVGAGQLHPADAVTVQKKVTYDWQA